MIWLPIKGDKFKRSYRLIYIQFRGKGGYILQRKRWGLFPIKSYFCFSEWKEYNDLSCVHVHKDITAFENSMHNYLSYMKNQKIRIRIVKDIKEEKASELIGANKNG